MAAFMDQLRPSVRRSFCAEVLAIAGTTSTGMNAADEAKAVELLEHDDEVCRKVVAAIDAELGRRHVA